MDYQFNIIVSIRPNISRILIEFNIILKDIDYIFIYDRQRRSCAKKNN